MKIWLLIIYGVLLAVACIAALYYFDIANVRVAVDALATNLPSFNLSGATGVFNGAFQWIQANPLATTVFGFLGTTAVGYVIKSWQTSKLLDASTQKLAQAQADILNSDALTANTASTVETLQRKIAVFEGDTTADSLQSRIAKMISEQDGYTQTIKTLEMQRDEALKAPAQIAEQLWSKSGGQILDIAGTKYRVIEKIITEVK